MHHGYEYTQALKNVLHDMAMSDACIVLLSYTQLRSYAIHGKSVLDNGIDFNAERGYTVYIFNHSNPSDYCILTEEDQFSELRILLWVAIGSLELTSALALPLVMARVYGNFKEKMSKKDSNMQYFVWAAIMVIVVLVVFLFVCNIFSINEGLSKETKFSDIKCAFGVFAGALIFLIVIDFGTTIVVFRQHARIDNVNLKFPSDCCSAWSNRRNTNPLVNQRHGRYEAVPDDNDRNDTKLTLKCFHISRLSLYYFSIFFVTLFAQLALFNLIYVFMAAIAAPVEVGSLLLFLGTSLFCFISFTALVLKVWIRSFEEYRLKNCIIFTGLFIFLTTFLLTGLGVFCAFVYTYTVLNQEYRNDRGILTFLGALVPSLVATLVGFFWTKVISCVEKTPNSSETVESNKTDRTSESKESSVTPNSSAVTIGTDRSSESKESSVTPNSSAVTIGTDRTSESKESSVTNSQNPEISHATASTDTETQTSRNTNIDPARTSPKAVEVEIMPAN